MDSLDKLLAELKAEFQSKSQSNQSQPTPIRPAAQPNVKSDSVIDDLLAEIKADFQKQERREELKRLQELEEKQVLPVENRNNQQLQTWRENAEKWLAKLDPFSPEGLWFERFAEKYSSKLEAAIDYLKNNEYNNF